MQVFTMENGLGRAHQLNQSVTTSIYFVYE